MIDAHTDTAFCVYKGTSGYGPCGKPRTPPTLREAAEAVLRAGGLDRDGASVIVPIRNPLGRRMRVWDDLALALEREGAE